MHGFSFIHDCKEMFASVDQTLNKNYYVVGGTEFACPRNTENYLL